MIDNPELCELCGGDLLHLGKSGYLEVWRCRACGGTYQIDTTGHAWSEPRELSPGEVEWFESRKGQDNE